MWESKLPSQLFLWYTDTDLRIPSSNVDVQTHFSFMCLSFSLKAPTSSLRAAVLLLRAATEDGVKAIHQNNLCCQWIFGCCFTGCDLIFPMAFFELMVHWWSIRIKVGGRAESPSKKCKTDSYFRDIPRIVNHQLNPSWRSFVAFYSWTSWFFIWTFAWFIGIVVTPHGIHALGFCTLTRGFSTHQPSTPLTYCTKGTQRSGCFAAKLRKNW